jgi:hypothetical protein
MNRMPRDTESCDACGKKVYVRQGKVLTGRAAREHDEDHKPSQRRCSIEEHHAMMRDLNHGAFLYFKTCVEAFPFLQISCVGDACSCAYCLAQKGKIIATAQATLDMIPPFAECSCDYCKCRCTFIAIDKQQAMQMGLPGSRPDGRPAAFAGANAHGIVDR